MTECNEYTQLLKRNGLPYSQGHRIMYDGPIAMMHGSTWDVLEIGFGIGYGLQRMASAKVVNHYWGCEPCQDSFEYVARIDDQGGIDYVSDKTLLFQPWSAQAVGMFDFAFCIEVIEHVEMDNHLDFLKSIRPFVRKNLFMSTPDLSKNKHGVRTEKEWLSALKEAGWNAIAISSQWTTLYICQPE